MEKNFDRFFNNLIDTISDYSYYVDFDKVYKNTEDFGYEIEKLNTLIGSKDIKNDFQALLLNNPEVVRAIPMLLAVRGSEIKVLDNDIIEYSFDKMNKTIEEYCYFMEKTNLFFLMENKKIKNLSDYLLGIEVGMDSNARKNRTGFAMENKVENYINAIKEEKKCSFFGSQVTKKFIKENWGIDLTYDDDKKDSEKRFDFVLKNQNYLYLFEVNFYNSSGSKLNETCKSFIYLNDKIKENQNVKFIWITDGNGWKKTKKNLEEAYDKIEHVYNINDLRSGVLEKIIK